MQIATNADNLVKMPITKINLALLHRRTYWFCIWVRSQKLLVSPDFHLYFIIRVGETSKALKMWLIF